MSEPPRAIIQAAAGVAATPAMDNECAVALSSYNSRVGVIGRQRNGENLNPNSIKKCHFR